jgi:lipopolysaccharide export system ATP-binding protein
MSRLEALGIAKRYRTRQVVKDLSLSVESGEVVGLLGPNGAGKTTAFYMIVGLVRCDTGRIHLAGRDVTKLPCIGARSWVSATCHRKPRCSGS